MKQQTKMHFALCFQHAAGRKMGLTRGEITTFPRCNRSFKSRRVQAESFQFRFLTNPLTFYKDNKSFIFQLDFTFLSTRSPARSKV